LPLKAIVNDWITKKFYPVLNVTQNDLDSNLVVTYNHPPYIIDNGVGLIPITFKIQSSSHYNTTDEIHWLNVQMRSEYAIPRIGSNEWILLNIQQVGKYIERTRISMLFLLPNMESLCIIKNLFYFISIGKLSKFFCYRIIIHILYILIFVYG